MLSLLTMDNATATAGAINLSDILTVVVAVISSLGAVILSAFLADYLRDKRDRNRARSLVVACLDSVYIQMPGVESFFKSLSRNVWTEQSFPALFSLSKTTTEIDLSLFAKIRENVLKLDVELADAMVSYELWFRRINREVKGWTEILSEGYVNEGTVQRAAIIPYLRLNSKFFQKEMELMITLANVTVDLRAQLFAGKKKITVDWSPVEKKSKESLDALAETLPPSTAQS